jgi:ketosteroid isomerase-like protein
MSQENVEIVRGIYDGWSAGNFVVGADHLDDHAVFVVRSDFPEWGVFHGPDGVKQYMRRFLEQWERLTVEAKDLSAVGDTVLARIVQHGKGRVSGIEGEDHYFMLFTFRGAKLLRIETVRHEADALKAVGLAD